MDKKTDNAHLATKLDLRRWFLRKFHSGAATRPNVLDCCQADGVLWRVLRAEFELAGYWGVDVKRKPGRLRIDSQRILAQPGWPQNVIDIDTYGRPWKHWLAMLPHVSRPTTVFMTIGIVSFGNMDRDMQAALGLDALGISVPVGLHRPLHELGMRTCVGRAGPSLTAREAIPPIRGTARYIGVHVPGPLS